jgi:rhodanese-related sulfurtransferase
VAGVPTIDDLLDEARAQLARVHLHDLPADAVLVDIREDAQIAEHGPFPGAVRIPRNVLEWRCDPRSQWRDPRVSDPARPIVLVCHEGYQSSLAAATLQDLGFSRATDLAGGFAAWRDAGLPVEPAPPPD